MSRRRHLPVLMALTVCLGAGLWAFDTATLHSDAPRRGHSQHPSAAADDLAIAQRASLGTMKVAFRAPNPPAHATGSQPTIARRALQPLPSASTAQFHPATPIYDLLHIYRL